MLEAESGEMGRRGEGRAEGDKLQHPTFTFVECHTIADCPDYLDPSARLLVHPDSEQNISVYYRQ